MAAVDYFLKIEGMDGESGDKKHQNEIEVEEYSWQAAQEGTGSGGGGVGAGKVKMGDFRILLRTCKATPNLMLACANGKPHKTATLTCRKAGENPQDYLIWTLSEVVVSSYNHIGKEAVSESGQKTVIPSDEVYLNFGSIQCEYKVQKDDGSLGGSVKTGWNRKQNQKM
jgi:type VI secretion system secreted protein Hcp